MLKYVLSVVITGLLTTAAVGSIKIEVVEIDNSASPILDGFRTFDLIITTTNQWTTSAIYLELDQGSIFQDEPLFSGGEFNWIPQELLDSGDLPGELEFDTFIRVPNFVQGNTATDIGGPQNVFPPATVGISRSWGMSQSLFDSNGLLSSGTQPVIRITLSDDAVGTWSFGATEVGSPLAKFLNNPITAGTPTLTPLRGDLNRDGLVDILDLNNVLSNWNQTVEDPFGEIDPNGDGLVDILDLNMVLSDWNTGTPPRPILATPLTFGDLNADGFVDLFDLKVPNFRWGQEVTPGDRDDPSGDGFVGLDDLSVVMATWNQGTPPAVIVPEPAALGVLSLGLAVVINRSRVRA